MSGPPLTSGDPVVQQLSADNTATFVLGSAYLVFFMHCGFAMVRGASFTTFCLQSYHLNILQTVYSIGHGIALFAETSIESLPWPLQALLPTSAQQLSV